MFYGPRSDDESESLTFKCILLPIAHIQVQLNFKITFMALSSSVISDVCVKKFEKRQKTGFAQQEISRRKKKPLVNNCTASDS